MLPVATPIAAPSLVEHFRRETHTCHIVRSSSATDLHDLPNQEKGQVTSIHTENLTIWDYRRRSENLTRITSSSSASALHPKLLKSMSSDDSLISNGKIIRVAVNRFVGL